MGNFGEREFAHAVDEKVGAAVDKDAGADAVFPIVEMRDAA